MSNDIQLKYNIIRNLFIQTADFLHIRDIVVDNFMRFLADEFLPSFAFPYSTLTVLASNLEKEKNFTIKIHLFADLMLDFLNTWMGRLGIQIYNVSGGKNAKIVLRSRIKYWSNLFLALKLMHPYKTPDFVSDMLVPPGCRPRYERERLEFMKVFPDYEEIFFEYNGKDYEFYAFNMENKLICRDTGNNQVVSTLDLKIFLEIMKERCGGNVSPSLSLIYTF